MKSWKYEKNREWNEEWYAVLHVCDWVSRWFRSTVEITVESHSQMLKSLKTTKPICRDVHWWLCRFPPKNQFNQKNVGYSKKWKENFICSILQNKFMCVLLSFQFFLSIVWCSPEKTKMNAYFETVPYLNIVLVCWFRLIRQSEKCDSQRESQRFE